MTSILFTMGLLLAVSRDCIFFFYKIMIWIALSLIRHFAKNNVDNISIYRHIDISMKNSFQLSFSFKTAYTAHSMYIYPHVSFKRSNYNSFSLLTFLWLKTVIFMKTTTWLFLRNFHADISIFENVYRYIDY